MDAALAFMKDWNENRSAEYWTLTPMQIVLCALARTVGQRPRINRFISNQRHYQRNNISFSFVTKKSLSDDGMEVNVIMPFRPEDTIADVNLRFKRFVGQAKSEDGNKTENDVEVFDRLPHWLIRLAVNGIRFLDRHNWITKDIIRMLPFYSTAFLTNVGSIGLDAPIHHNFEIGNTGIFAALGKMKQIRELQADGSVEEYTVMPVTYTFDDRIVDGIYSGRAMGLLRNYIENPEQLTEVPEISPKNLKELMLTEEGFDLWDQMA